MSLVKFKPTTFGQWPSIFDEFFSDSGEMASVRNFSPAVNVKESDSAFTLELAAPGVSKEDFSVDLDHNVLTVSAESKAEHNEDAEKYTRREFGHAKFSRSFTLPDSVDSEFIDAKHKNGVLVVTLPKKKAETANNVKQIEVD